MCNHLPPLPKTGFSSPTDLPRDGKTLDVLLTSALARVHLNWDFCSPVWVWLNGLGDIPLQHLTAFFWHSQAATSKSQNVLLSFLNSQFLISKEILSLRSLIQEYWHKISLQWPCCTMYQLLHCPGLWVLLQWGMRFCSTLRKPPSLWADGSRWSPAKPDPGFSTR